nr:2-dehydro-3-deoxy-6-phosphogalactonate aldolase [Amylibacter sp.]
MSGREIIAILRGVRRNEVVAIGQVLLDAGIDKIEVPLNSPEAFESIALLADAFHDSAVIGAGTVLTPQDVVKVHQQGGAMVVSPDCNPDVIKATKALGMLSYPGVFTPTEAFTALRSGADGIKIFPASGIGPAGLAAMLAVLPTGTRSYAVGGVGPDSFAPWIGVGVTGFGIGTGLFKPGFGTADVAKRAADIVAAYDRSILK